jgi:myosin-7
MGAKRAKEEAERSYKERMLQLEQEKREAERRDRDEVRKKRDLIQNAKQNDYVKDDNNLVDEMFSTILPHQHVHSPQHGEIIENSIPRLKQDENLDEYVFSKFAATYFQGNATPEYSKKPLKQSLLPLKSEGDQLAALAVWITILRFMGDLPDIKLHTTADTRPSRVI